MKTAGCFTNDSCTLEGFQIICKFLGTGEGSVARKNIYVLIQVLLSRYGRLRPELFGFIVPKLFYGL